MSPRCSRSLHATPMCVGYASRSIDMTISSISSTTTSAVQWQSTQRPQRPNFEKDMTAVADLLGVSTDDLKSELQSDKSLADIADAKGVSRDDLLATLEQSMKANA